MQSDTLVEKDGFRSETKSGSIILLKRAFSIPVFRSSNPIGAFCRKTRFFRQDVRTALLNRKVFEVHRISHHPTQHKTTPHNGLQPLRCWIDCYYCCCSQRVSVARPVLRPLAARTVIRWQQCMLSITFSQHRCCCYCCCSCCACFGDSRRSPTPQPRR